MFFINHKIYSIYLQNILNILTKYTQFTYKIYSIYLENILNFSYKIYTQNILIFRDILIQPSEITWRIRKQHKRDDTDPFDSFICEQMNSIVNINPDCKFLSHIF